MADRSRNEILEIVDYRRSGTASRFAGTEHGIADPVAVAIAPGDSLLVVAGGAHLTLLDIGDGTVISQLDLGFEPTSLLPLGGSSAFLLRNRGSDREALQVLMAGRQPTVYFVPAARTARE